MGPLKPNSSSKAFGEQWTETCLREGVEIVGFGVLGAVLKSGMGTLRRVRGRSSAHKRSRRKNDGTDEQHTPISSCLGTLRPGGLSRHAVGTRSGVHRKASRMLRGDSSGTGCG